MENTRWVKIAQDGTWTFSVVKREDGKLVEDKIYRIRIPSVGDIDAWDNFENSLYFRSVREKLKDLTEEEKMPFVKAAIEEVQSRNALTILSEAIDGEKSYLADPFPNSYAENVGCFITWYQVVDRSEFPTFYEWKRVFSNGDMGVFVENLCRFYDAINDLYLANAFNETEKEERTLSQEEAAMQRVKTIRFLLKEANWSFSDVSQLWKLNPIGFHLIFDGEEKEEKLQSASSIKESLREIREKRKQQNEMLGII